MARTEASRSTSEHIDLAAESGFSLGQMAVRPAICEVECAGAVERLEPRVMQVLVALARANGAVLSRDELIQSCWGGVVVGDDAINRAVGRIRRLSQIGPAPSFAIETIPRVGYRLVRKGGSAAEAPPPKLWRVTRLRLAIVAGALSLLVALAIILSLRDRVLEVRAPVVIAVLPFDDLGSGGDLADGIAAEIHATLGRLPLGVRMISTASSFQLRGADKDPVIVRHRLTGATHMIDGSVRGERDNVRVIVQLIDLENAAVLWTETYDRPFDRALEVERNVALEVAGVLHVAAPELADPQRVSAEALQHYLRGMKRIRQGLGFSAHTAEAVRELEQTVRFAPRFARAHAALAEAYRYRMGRVNEAELAPLAAKARAAAREALRLDRRMGYAQATLGYLEPEWNWDARMEHLERALASSPNDARVLAFQRDMLARLGRRREAKIVSDAIARLNPLSDEALERTIHRLFEGRGALAAEEDLRRMVRQDPGRAGIWLVYFGNRVDAIDLEGARRARAEILNNWDTLRANLPWGNHSDGVMQWMNENIEVLENWPPSQADIDSWAAENMQILSKAVGQGCAVPRILDLASPREIPGGYGKTEEAFTAFEELYLRRGLVGTSDNWGCTPVFLDRKSPTTPLFHEFAVNLRRDTRIWRIFGAVGLAEYWRRTNIWPDFCAEPDLPYDCRSEAQRVRAR